MEEMIRIVIGLLIFMMANVMLGSVNSLFDGTFNKKKFLSGIGKALVIIIVYIAVYFAGSLNPDIIVLELDGAKMNVLTALYVIAVSGYIAYAKQILDKLKLLLTPKATK